MTEYIPRDRDSTDAVVSSSDELSPKVCIAILGLLEAFLPVLEAFFRCEMIDSGHLSSKKKSNQVQSNRSASALTIFRDKNLSRAARLRSERSKNAASSHSALDANG